MTRNIIIVLVVLALLLSLMRSGADERQHDSGGTAMHGAEGEDPDPKGELFIEGGPSNVSDWVSWDSRWPSRSA